MPGTECRQSECRLKFWLPKQIAVLPVTQSVDGTDFMQFICLLAWWREAFCVYFHVSP